jgi:hypothetical protein
MINASSAEAEHDKRPAYRVRVRGAASNSFVQTFSRLADFIEALRLLESSGAEYLYWGPGWEGGSVRLSRPAAEIWQRIAQPARRPPKRAATIASATGSGTQAVA